MSAVGRSRHVYCEAPHQQPDAKPWFCVAGGGGKPPPNLRDKTLVQHIQGIPYAWQPPPAKQNHGVVSQTKLQTQIHDLLQHQCILTAALRQKLSTEQTSTIAYNQSLGMGLDPKLTAQDPISYSIDSRALVGPPGSLWAGPLWVRAWALVGH